MRKTTKLLIALCTLTAAFSALAACGGTATADIDAPTSLKLKNAKLSWKAVDGVTYEVSTDGKNYVAVEEDEVNLLDIVNSTSVTKIYVRGAVGKAKGPVAEYPITVQTLATPEKATYEFNQEAKQHRLVWEEVEGADKYEVLVTTDGVESSKWITYATNYYAPTKTGEYTIKVRCKGYSEDDILYIPDGASEVSESITMLTAPVLQAPAINRIIWRSETEFDSYNLLIQDKNGVEVKHENVTLSGIDLDLVTNAYITKTGEYDLTIEGVKNGVSYYSNTYVEFGTTNINENEFYSFDNRKANMSNAQAGLTISNEEYYGKSEGAVGHSLKIDGADDSVKGQFNLIKYSASGVNDWIASNITRISYQVFVPAGQKDLNGEEITSLRYDQLPTWKYEGVNGSAEDATYGYVTKSFYDDARGEAYEVGKWHKITITGENIVSDLVLIMQCSYIESQNIVAYIDEITVEGYEDRSSIVKAKDNMPDGAEYVTSLTRSALVNAWQDGDRMAMDFGKENANKQVDISFKVKGTANAERWPDLGFIIYKEARWDQEGEKGAPIDANGNGIEGEYYVHSINRGITAIGQMDEWVTLTFKNVTLNELGKIWIDPFADFSGKTDLNATVEDEFNIYFKDIQIDKVLPQGFEKVGYNHSGNPADKENNLAFSLALDQSYFYAEESGKWGTSQYVNVTMKVTGNLAADFEGAASFTAYGWGIANGYPGQSYGDTLRTRVVNISSHEEILAALKSNAWTEITIRVPHYYNTPVVLVPSANGYTNPFEVYVKDIVADYSTISDFMEWPDENAVQVKANDASKMDVFAKGGYEKLQLVINGNVIKEDITGEIVEGTLDIAKYLYVGANSVKIVGVQATGNVESATLSFTGKPMDALYATEYTQALSAAKEWNNKTSVFTLDFGTEYANKTGVAITMKVKGDVTADNANTWFGFCMNHGDTWKGVTSPIAKEALLATNNDWTSVTVYNVTLDGNGQVILGASNGAYGKVCVPYTIYVKEAKIEGVGVQYGETKTGWFAESGIKSDSNGATNIALKSGDGTTGNVRFKIKIKGTALATADSKLKASLYGNSWAVNNGNRGFVKVIEGDLDAALRQSAEYKEVTIETTVVSGSVLLLCAWDYEGCNGTHLNYQNNNWTQTCPLGETHKNAALTAGGFAAVISEVIYLGAVS